MLINEFNCGRLFHRLECPSDSIIVTGLSSIVIVFMMAFGAIITG